MNNTIDHAILVPAYAKTVWQHLSNMEENPSWQAGCERIAYLNSVRDQKGIRYRAFGKGRNESVIEVTAWYPGLGYEYVIVDGFDHPNRGRIRLQEVAEGTVVQWTFNYETSGLVGGLSNSLSIKRRVNNEVIHSLQSLYQYIGQVAEKPDTNLIKSMMRDAPDATDRANYQPRYPSALDEPLERPTLEAPRSEAYARANMSIIDDEIDLPDEAEEAADAMFMRPGEHGGINIVEPPLSDADTQPNPVIQDEDLMPQASASAEAVDAAPALSAAEPEASDRYVIPRPPFEPSVVTDDKRSTDEHEVTESAETRISEADATAPTRLDKLEAASKSYQGMASSPPPGDDDTSRVSVFELFGLQKPSETQEMKAIQDAQIEALDALDEAHEEVLYELVDRGTGLRIKLRRELVNVKFPH
ncbi:MAG: SRPBCC family protein [Anaerolineae bacterium]|nr:SRPBCC family protein [Anaerolineae bacterium]